MGRKTFCKLSTVDKKPCFLLSEIEDNGKDGIKLTISDGESAWNGELTGDDLEDMCKKIKMKFSDFVSETVKAFTKENVGNLNFLYQIKTHGDDAVELTWKKYVAVEDIKFQLGKVVLQSVADPAQFTRDLFTHSIEEMSGLKEQINSLETDNLRLSQERSQALKRLDKCVAAKEQIEKDLYSKFVAVLNSKKHKIHELKKEIQEGGQRSNGEDTSANIASTSKPTGEDESMEEGLEEGSSVKSEEEITDDEVTPPPRRRRGGANLKRKVSDSGDASLILDEGEDIQPSVASRRPRRQASGKKTTPAKPVLPRVTSDEKTETPSRGSRLRKSGSGSRSTSQKMNSEVPDAEDLLEDL